MVLVLGCNLTAGLPTLPTFLIFHYFFNPSYFSLLFWQNSFFFLLFHYFFLFCITCNNSLKLAGLFQIPDGG